MPPVNDTQTNCFQLTDRTRWFRAYGTARCIRPCAGQVDRSAARQSEKPRGRKAGTRPPRHRPRRTRTALANRPGGSIFGRPEQLGGAHIVRVLSIVQAARMLAITADMSSALLCFEHHLAMRHRTSLVEAVAADAEVWIYLPRLRFGSAPLRFR